jgi:hypothetical protein
MPNALTDDYDKELIAVTSLNDLIGKQVIRELGTPKDLLKVKVHHIGADRYRVNIVTGNDFTTGRIANSFFLTADAKGKIVGSTPKIVKLY